MPDNQPVEAMNARWRLIPSLFGGTVARGWKATNFNVRI